MVHSTEFILADCYHGVQDKLFLPYWQTWCFYIVYSVKHKNRRIKYVWYVYEMKIKVELFDYYYYYYGY